MNIGLDFDGTLVKINPSGYSLLSGVADALQSLYSNSVGLHIVTAREKEDKEALQIIEDIESNLKIKFSSVVFTCHQSKGKICKDIGCKFMIDDYKGSVVDCKDHGVEPILFQYDKDRDYLSFCDWGEICVYLLNQTK